MLRKNLPLLAFFVVGGLALAQTATPSRKFPYAGFLEENGAPVNGSRAMQIKLFTSDTTTTVCDTQSFSSVNVAAGRFAVTLAGVPDACLTTGEIFLEVAVGPVGGTLVSLSTGTGSGRASIAASPFASAIAGGQNLMGGVGSIVFERLGGQSRIGVDPASATAIIVQPLADIGDGNALLSVRSSDGTERLRVDDNDDVLVNEKLTVAGAAQLSSTLNVTGATTLSTVSASGAGTLGSLTVSKTSNVSTINLPAPSGGNDAGAIEHIEPATNTGELWIKSSDDWGAGSSQTQDRIIFGNRATNVVKHEFDAVGNAEHVGDLVVGGAVSSTCPTGMSFAGGWCIDNAAESSNTHGNAMTQCGNEGKMMCPYEALMACDHFQPGGSTCSSFTRNTSAVLFTSTRHTERDDFDESWHNNIACFKGDRTIQECSIGQSFQYFCCSHAFPGTP